MSTVTTPPASTTQSQSQTLSPSFTFTFRRPQTSGFPADNNGNNGNDGGGGPSSSLYRMCPFAVLGRYLLTLMFLPAMVYSLHVPRYVLRKFVYLTSPDRSLPVTLALLLAISTTIIVRSLLMRRRIRRAILNGTYVDPYAPKPPELGEKPKMWEVFIDHGNEKGAVVRRPPLWFPVQQRTHGHCID